MNPGQRRSFWYRLPVVPRRTSGITLTATFHDLCGRGMRSRPGHRTRFVFPAVADLDNVPNDFAPARREGAAERIVELRIGQVSQTVEDGCRQVLGPDKALFRIGSDSVGCTVHLAATHSSARQGHGKDMAPMV